PQVVRTPAVSSRSFTPKGMPWSGPRYFPWAISRSAAAACASASSRTRVMVQLSWPWYRSSRASASPVRRTEPTSRDCTHCGVACRPPVRQGVNRGEGRVLVAGGLARRPPRADHLVRLRHPPGALQHRVPEQGRNVVVGELELPPLEEGPEAPVPRLGGLGPLLGGQRHPHQLLRLGEGARGQRRTRLGGRRARSAGGERGGAPWPGHPRARRGPPPPH